MASRSDLIRLQLRRGLSFILSKDALVMLICIALASLFWYIVALGDEYEQDFHVKLSLRNVPENVVVTTDLPSEVTVTLKDKGSRLLSYKYGGGLPTLNIDFRNYSQGSGHVTLHSSDLSKLLLPKLLPSTRISAFKPEAVDYYYNYGLHSRLPIRLRANLQPEKFYSVGGVRLTPDSVTVYATQEVLDTMTAVYTDRLEISGISERTVRRVGFVPVKGAKFEPANVLVRVDIDQITEKTVKVPVRWVNFPASMVLRTFPSSVDVTFQVGMSLYKQITSEDFVIVVNYDDVLQSAGGKLHLKLKSIPAGVTHVRISPEDIDYLIENVED